MSETNLTGADLFKSNKILWEETPTRRVWLIRDGDKIYIDTEDKVDAILAENQRLESEFNYTGSHGEVVHVASVPTALYFDLMKQGKTEDREAYHRFLNDPDFAKFRTNNWTV